MIRAFAIVIILSGALWSCSQGSVTSYPLPVPSGSPLPFLPGIVSTDSFEFNSAFSPDGKSYLFSREDIHNIYETHFDGKQWSTPSMTSFSEPLYKECDPAFAPDGSKLYYISTRPVTSSDTTDDFNIWYVEQESGQWSEPHLAEGINSDSSEFYVSFSVKGNLYFASNRAGGFGSFDIYMSRLENGTYQEPVNLGNAVNDEHFEHDPFISSDERFLIYTSVNRKDGLGRGDLYFSIRNDHGEWSPAKNLGPTINRAEYDFCPYISPDGQYFFYSDNKDIQWMDAATLYRIMGVQ